MQTFDEVESERRRSKRSGFAAVSRGWEEDWLKPDKWPEACNVRAHGGETTSG
jgi:hypothetical protein